MEKRFLVLLQIFCGTLIAGSIAALATFWIHPDLASNLRCLFVVIPLVLCWYITQKFHSILLFLLSACVMTAGVFLLAAKGDEQYLFAVVTIVIWGSFLFAKCTNKECWLLRPHMGGVALFFCMYVFGSTQGFPYLCYLAHYFTIFYILGLMLYLNQHRFLDFVQKNFQSANLPYSRIRSINRLLITIMTTIAAVILFALPVSGMGGLWGLIQKLLVFLLRPIFALLEGGETPPPVEEPTLPEAPEMPTGGLAQLDGAENPIWSILSSILITICLIAVIIGIVKLLMYFIKNYHKHISKDGDQVEFIDRSAEAISAKQEVSQSRLPSRSSDPTIQIRKLYKKRILNQRKQAAGASSPAASGTASLLGVDTSKAPPTFLERLQNRLRPSKTELPNAAYTPAQIEADSDVADTLLHNMYEQARYSKEGCTNEDLALLKHK